ncbi:MAG: hypothetical protein ACMUIP_05490 [bacterium]
MLCNKTICARARNSILDSRIIEGGRVYDRFGKNDVFVGFGCLPVKYPTSPTFLDVQSYHYQMEGDFAGFHWQTLR